MTTLTANVSARPDHCLHKLPSSCRLTALPICCACQDIRPHAPLYRKYIDGVGFVLKGRRQERYCWQCKVFWDRRVADSGIPQEKTEIPDSPDQADFITKWFEWHQGFRTIRREDEATYRQAMVGESLPEVDIGCLPRTITDLRDGLLESSEQRLIKTRQRAAYQAQLQAERDANGEGQQENDDEVAEEDRLFDPESSSMLTTTPMPVAPRQRPQNRNFPSSIPIDTTDAVQNLREAFETSFTEGFAASLPEVTRMALFDTSAHFPRFDRALEDLDSNLLDAFMLDLQRNMHQHLDESDAITMNELITNSLGTGEVSLPRGPVPSVAAHPTDSHPRLDQDLYLRSAARRRASTARNAVAAQVAQPLGTTNLTGLNIAGSQSLLAQYERDIARVQRHLSRLAPLGTQEEVQDPDYISPVANMFNNFMTQHVQRQAEQRARAEALFPRTGATVPRSNDDPIPSTNTATAPASDNRRRPSSIPPRRRITSQASQPSERQGTNSEYTFVHPIDPHFEASARLQSQQARRNQSSARDPLTEAYYRAISNVRQLQSPSLDDTNDDRPPPLEGDDMMVRMQCAVCYSQVATQAMLPCGHLAMCRWCQHQAVPAHRLDATQPSNTEANCPVCRRRVQKIVRIYGPEEIASQRRGRRAGNAPTNTDDAADTVE